MVRSKDKLTFIGSEMGVSGSKHVCDVEVDGVITASGDRVISGMKTLASHGRLRPCRLAA
ncbi:MAG: hypothetical protein ACP5I8_16415 [Phycisphaerae bacterium]